MMHKFNSLDLDFTIVWSNFQKHKDLNILFNGLKTLAIAGQPNALAKWFEFFKLGDCPQIDKKMTTVEADNTHLLIAKGLYEKQRSLSNNKPDDTYLKFLRSAINISFKEYFTENIEIDKLCLISPFCDAIVSYTKALPNESQFNQKRKHLQSHLYTTICSRISDFNRKYQMLSTKGELESYPQFAFSYANILSTFFTLGPRYDKLAQTEEAIYEKLTSLPFENFDERK